MVVVKRTYTDKSGNEIALKTPQIRIGNNLGEDEEVIVVFKKGCYENKYDLTKTDKSGKEIVREIKSYTFLADFNGEDVYVKITELTFKKLLEVFGVKDTIDLNMFEGAILKFKRTIDDGGRTIIEVCEHLPEM